MEYIKVAEAAEKWGLTPRRVRAFCAENRIAGVIKKGNVYLIPADAPRPVDGRRKEEQKPLKIVPPKKHSESKLTYGIRDIAEMAGVSIATVSRYLNHQEAVSPATADNIRQIIEESGYVPNALTQGVFHNEIKVLGLIIPSVADSYFNYMAKLIEANASQHNYATILCNTDDQPEKERKHIELLQRLRVSGIITVRPRCKEDYANCICPVVSYENSTASDRLTVVSNDFESGRKAFELLYKKGSRHFLMIKGPKYLTASENRYHGFYTAAQQRGCDISVCELPTDYNFFMDGQFLNQYLLNSQIDGIFAFTDMIAVITLYWLQAHGRKVPEDVRLIGFDNSDISSLIRPNLTTFALPGEEICKTLVDSIINIIRGQELQEKEIVMASELVERGTT